VTAARIFLPARFGFAFFSLLNPLATIAIALLGFRMRRPEATEAAVTPDRAA
jgi:hypothetical protein